MDKEGDDRPQNNGGRRNLNSDRRSSGRGAKAYSGYNNKKPKSKAASGSAYPVLDEQEKILLNYLPRHLPRRANDIYVNSLSNFKSLKSRGIKQLNDLGWIVIHGLGAGIAVATNLALVIQNLGSVGTTLEARTSTIYMSDEYYLWEGRNPNNGAIHLKLSQAQIKPEEKQEIISI